MNKVKLIDLANELLKEEHLENRTQDLLFLKREYKYLASKEEETFYERQLSEQFNSLYEELAKKEPKLTQSTQDEKKEIIEEARKLLDRKDIVKANRELDELSLLFKKAGRCSKEVDDELYAQFKKVKDEFYTKKHAYFDELDKSNKEKIAKKEDIISRAKELLNIKNIKDSSEKMDALLEEWKLVGYAGKKDEELWHSFSSVRKEFNAKKKERHNEIQKLLVDRASKKEELIKVAKKLVADSDFSNEELKRVKDLRKEFNNVGFAGKEKEDELNAKFDEVIRQYFDEKKFYTM